MGRRSTNTTKSGKYMNPADQARKEARRKELKKNKKSRMAVRHAVLKAKSPTDLIFEMEKVDVIEYDTEGPPKLHIKVLQEKRRKLTETFSRVMKMCEKESPEEYAQFKKAFQEYERRRAQMEEYAKSVRIASEVTPNDIPLPDIAQASDVYTASQFSNTDEIPLPGLTDIALPQSAPLHSILKRTKQHREKLLKPEAKKNPPGPPPGEPPELSDSSEESSDNEEEDGDVKEKSASKVRFDADVADEERDTRTLFKRRMKALPSEEDDEEEPPAPGPAAPSRGPAVRQVVMRPPPGVTPGLRPPPGVFAIAGVPPPGPRRIPPPPPGLPPPRMLRPPMLVPGPVPAPGGLMVNPDAVLSAPPSLNIRPGPPEPMPPGIGPLGPIPLPPSRKPRSATIEAKPQLRNMQAEVVKLVPTAVKVKRASGAPVVQGPAKKERIVSSVFGPHTEFLPQKPQQKTKDDAYDQFMKEMSGLI